MAKPTIEIKEVTKVFSLYPTKSFSIKESLLIKGPRVEKKEVLHNVNLSINKGEVVALIGTNGSGKSTLLKLISQIMYPDSGKILARGKITSLLELGAGFHPDFTGRENIYFNASIFGLSRKEINNRIADIIEFSELGDYIDSPIRTYSSGMYMRLAFSIAINVDAEILLIDEILAVGDQHFHDKCISKIVQLTKEDITIVMVSHDLNSIRKICNRVIWLYNGRVELDGEPNLVIEKYLERCK